MCGDNNSQSDWFVKISSDRIVKQERHGVDDGSIVGVARLQSEVGTKGIFESEISMKKMLREFPQIIRPLFWCQGEEQLLSYRLAEQHRGIYVSLFALWNLLRLVFGDNLRRLNLK